MVNCEFLVVDDVLKISHEMPEITNDVLEPNMTQLVNPISSSISFSYSDLTNILILSSPNPISNYNTFDDSFSHLILLSTSVPLQASQKTLFHHLVISFQMRNQTIDSSLSIRPNPNG